SLLKVDPASYSTLVTKVLGVSLILTSMALIFRRRLLATYSRRVGVLTESQTRLYTIIVGLVLGVLVTISSVGAGALDVTALLLLYPELPIVKIAGSDIAHAVPLTLVAGLGHLMSGSMNLTVLVSLLCGSLPGIVLSSQFAPRMPDAVLRYVLALTLILVSLRLLSAGHRPQESPRPRLAAYAQRPAAGPARAQSAGYRDRGHRPWPGPCRALEWPDQGS